ncbi:non-ribosomal peptide synthetase [Lentzea fradiae]|uniref:non-ribosomal peptide synthetase n=1 Tax=Lentzea fradiae TaxID=200378 RepID=UPI00115FAB03|nr:non-ribosomal peptide synthetase [Lentzea fradiae]
MLDDSVSSSPAEGDRVPDSWNDTARPFEDTATLVDLVARSVRRDPGATALRSGAGRELSYAELWDRAGAVADVLVADGIGRGDYVGVLVEHSEWAITAILAVVRTGAAYVPLDPRWPAARLAEPLGQLSVRWVLTSARQAGLAEEAVWLGSPSARMVCLDATSSPMNRGDEDEAREFWDEVAGDEDELRAAGFNRGADVFRPEQVRAYVGHVADLATADAPGSVLEIGCGTGLIAAELAGRVSEYVGVDPSPVAVRRAAAVVNGRAAASSVHTGFAHEVEKLFGSRKFDVVLLSSVVQFFPGPDYARKVLRAAVSLLAPGGRVVVADVVSYDEPGTGGHVRLPRTWFDQLVEEFDVPVEVEVVDRSGDHWHESLACRYDVVLRRVGGPARTGRRRVLTWTDVEAAPASEVPRPAQPGSSAYVIFTSGSSGRPKGVEVRHRSVVNLVDWVNRTYDVSSSDCLLLVTAFTFDLSVYDVFGLLAAGGTIRVLGDEELADPDRLADVLDHEPVTFWDSAPAALSQVMAVASTRPVPAGPALRLVFLSGDWVPLHLPDQVRSRFPAARVVALGGATEATVWSNHFDVGEVDPAWPSIPYGRPIQNARYYVLDEQGAPCPIGEPGELHIAGEVVAAGYAGDAELTAARFLPDPFAGGAERMYATGDRARWLPEGVVQFLGRTDDQVKVRGYRIELGDVQTALRRVEGVSDAVALVVDGANGKELVGAVAGAGLTAAGVRARLAGLLPSYMVPDHLVPLPTLPVGPTGKVDRRAVADLVLERSERWRATTPQETGHAVVDQVLALVRDVLEREVGVEESFLDAGGHSLAAAHLRTRIRSALGPTLRVSDILGAGSVAELAALVSTHTADVVETSAEAPIRPDGRYPVSRAQARALFEIRNVPDVPAYQNQVSIRLPAHLGVERIEAAFAAVIAARPVLRANFRPVEAEWECVIGDPWTPEIEVVDLRRPGQSGEQREQALAAALREHNAVDWDLASGRPVVWRLLRVSDDEWVLSQIEHHLVHDGWSLTLLLRSLLDALAGVPLQPEPRSYHEHVAAEAVQAAGLADAPHFRSRVEALTGAPTEPVSPLPDIGRHSGETAAARADAISVVLEGESYRALERWAQQRGATSFELLMAAFLATLHDQSGVDDLVIGSAVSARPPGFEATLGMFVNTVPVRARWEDDFGAFLAVVSSSLRDAVDAELIPYDALLDGVRRAEGTRRDALYRCMFSAHNAALPDTAVAGGGRAFLEYHQNGTAKTPLDVLVLPKQPDADSAAPPGSVRLVWEFDRSLYSTDLVRAMVDRFTTGLVELAGHVLAGSADGWTWPATAPSVLTGPPARHRPDYAPRAAATPAIVGMDGTTTHDDLARMVKACARELAAAGVGDGDVVAVDVARDAAHCARVLAVSAAGAAVMPVSGSMPADRLRAALSTAHARWTADGVLTRLDHAAVVPAEPDTAYVVHTSGSTGTPKRVPVSRATAAAYTAAFADELGLTSNDVVAATASPLFDAWFEEVLPVLAVGGAVLLTNLGDGIPGLLDQVEAAGATVLDLPTALWTVLADHLARRDERLPACVRAVVIGGEAYDPALAAAFVRRHRGAVTLLSTYGPSECGVSVAFHRVGGAESRRGAPQLGRPIPGSVLCVVDHDGRGVPVGRPGVLGIGGVPCRPGLPGTRPVDGVDGPVYLTGDLVRLTHQGEIDFLGRADGGLKVRGFRVAPEEVERAALLVGGVSRAAATDVPAPDGSPRLGLVVVTDLPSRGTQLRSAVRTAMSAHVPDYMLPEVVVAVPELPVNQHGKVDRAEVRSLLAAEPWSADGAPSHQGGGRLRTLWSSALGAAAPHDVDFITAGGDSLSAMRLATAIENEFSVRLRFRDVLRAESCAALADLVSTMA